MKKLYYIGQGFETDVGGTRKHLRLWLRLLTCTSLLENEVRSRLKETFDETLAQFDLMAQLDRRPEGLTMSELSARLMVTNGNITGLVDRLIRRNLVQRVPLASDRRTLNVVMTLEGKALFRTTASQHERWIKDLLGDMSPEEVDTLMDLLATTRTTLQSAIKRGREAESETKKVRQLAKKPRR